MVDSYKEKEKELAGFAKALSHPARIAILNVLAKKKNCICGEIVEVLPLAQSTVSQHLKELKKYGLIKGTIEGVTSCYCIDWKNFETAVKAFGTFSGRIIDHKVHDQSCC